MFKFKPLHALLAVFAMAGCGMAKAIVTEYEPLFSDPSELFDVGDDDPYMYRWITDPNMIDMSSWAYGGTGLASYSIASVWINEALQSPNDQLQTINAGQPLFALSGGASCPIGGGNLPYACQVQVHVYAQLDATAYFVGGSGASSHAEAGSSYLDSNDNNFFDMGSVWYSVPLTAIQNANQPTVAGTVTITPVSLLTRGWNLCDDHGDYNSAYAKSEIQYYITNWHYMYRTPIHR
jgi:hypothetical protein